MVSTKISLYIWLYPYPASLAYYDIHGTSKKAVQSAPGSHGFIERLVEGSTTVATQLLDGTAGGGQACLAEQTSEAVNSWFNGGE